MNIDGKLYLFDLAINLYQHILLKKKKIVSIYMRANLIYGQNLGYSILDVIL